MRQLSWMFLSLLVFNLWVVIGKTEENHVPVVVTDDGVGTVERITWEKDGAEMVLIPSGSFKMGDSKNELEEWMEDSRPVHTVELDAFYIDTYEVTVGQFKRFLEQTGYGALPDWVSQYSPTDSHPVVFVTWHDAMAYCQWAEKRLPTEAEWEYAARGGLVDKRYSWGNTEPNGQQCNYADKNADTTLRQINKDYTWAEMRVDDGYAMTAPVGKYSPNGYGLYDISGNVYEWCADWYDEGYYSNSPPKNPPGPNTGSDRVVRGGSWSYDAPHLRVAYRTFNDPVYRNNRFGFRCVSGGR